MDHPIYPINQELFQEMSRLDSQARVLNEHVSSPDVPPSARILDLACGPGLWAFEMAAKYKHSHVTGLDKSHRMIEFATMRARVEQVENVTFLEGDATKPLPFADAAFDFVHARGVQGFIAISDWSKLLQEIKRVLKPGGLVQLVEGERPVTNAPAFDHMNALLTQAGFKSGTSASPEGHHFGVAEMLPRFLREAGFVLGEHTAYPIDFSHGKVDAWRDNMLAAFKLMGPYLLQYTQTPLEETERMCADIEREMASEDFCAMILAISIVARKPDISTE